jgi:hypothetical protein
MKISVSSKNEFKFYPDVWGNMDLEEKERFAVVVKKISRALGVSKWTKFDTDGNIEVDLDGRIKSQIVKLINAPLLEIDGGKKSEVLTIDILYSGLYTQLDPLLSQISDYIADLEVEDDEKVKKH